MAPFNWFKRQFSGSQKEETPASEAPSVEMEKPAEKSAPPEPESTQEPTAADRLAWAKAAYQTIQQRKQAEGSSPEAIEVPPETPEAAVPEPEVERREEPGDTPQPPPAAVEAEPVATSELSPAREAEAEPQTPEAASPEESSQPVSETPQPFWARAEAERQDRLERLRQEAEAAEAEAETPVHPEISAPEPVTSAVAPETTVAPSVAEPAASELDEGFLWSASVLAAQGRRPDEIDIEEITWLKRLRQGLDKTRRGLVNQLKAVVGQGPLNEDAVMEIEALLLQADVGVQATDAVIEALQAKMRQEVLPPEQAIAYLKSLLRDMLDAPLENRPAMLFPEKDTLNIWLITGVNGAGKTTTIGKLAHVARKSGYTCLIGAADTFRAAAVEQVKVWGQRSNVDVIANPGKNTDPAAVVFDAITAAQSRQTELLLLDTAGRLQNKKNLMEELNKIRRIIDKKAAGAQVESLLVLDATLGQNGLRQAEVFAEVAQLSGVILTKLDSSAKGGVALAVVQQLGLPIRFIGAGEGIEDLRPFSSYEFVEALLSG
jgi:fused signal recognition particle receptor